MASVESREPLEELRQIADQGDGDGLRRLLAELPAGEVSRVMSRLEDQEQAEVLTLLTPAEAADLVAGLADFQAADVMEELAPAEAAAILHELPSNDQADLIQELGRDDAEAILAALEPAEAQSVRALAAYPHEAAGGLMVTEYLAYHEDATVAEVIGDLRTHADTYRDYQVQYLYVTGPDDRLVGVLRLHDLLMSPAEVRLRSIMIPEPVTVRPESGFDEIREIFEGRSFLGVPVVDGAGRLAGLIRFTDVQEAMADRADSTYRKSQGIVGGEELRSMPIFQRAGRRLSWLSINIVLNVIAASVIAVYQETLAAVIALAAFLPIISDMSGCSGNQAAAVSMRELALGAVRPGEVLRTLWKELSVGIVNGLVLGVLLGLTAWWWQGNVFLGLVVGGALAINTLVAVSIGGSVPLVLRRLGFDPALASGPLLTTVTDLCGFFLALSFATALLPRLIA
jgi:magnesium transporter